MDLKHGPDILNTEVYSAQKQSKPASYVGLETIELSDLIISMDLPTNAVARYKFKIVHVCKDPYTMPSEICVSYDNDSIYAEVTYPDIYNYLISAPSPYTVDQLKTYKGLTSNVTILLEVYIQNVQ